MGEAIALGETTCTLAAKWETKIKDTDNNSV